MHEKNDKLKGERTVLESMVRNVLESMDRNQLD